MEHQKIFNLMSGVTNSTKWNIINDQAKANYDIGNEIIYNTEVLKSTLCES